VLQYVFQCDAYHVRLNSPYIARQCVAVCCAVYCNLSLRDIFLLFVAYEFKKKTYLSHIKEFVTKCLEQLHDFHVICSMTLMIWRPNPKP